jgi:hypothetical protein
MFHIQFWSFKSHRVISVVAENYTVSLSYNTSQVLHRGRERDLLLMQHEFDSYFGTNQTKGIDCMHVNWKCDTGYLEGFPVFIGIVKIVID